MPSVLMHLRYALLLSMSCSSPESSIRVCGTSSADRGCFISLATVPEDALGII